MNLANIPQHSDLKENLVCDISKTEVDSTKLPASSSSTSSPVSKVITTSVFPKVNLPILPCLYKSLFYCQGFLWFVFEFFTRRIIFGCPTLILKIYF